MPHCRNASRLPPVGAMPFELAVDDRVSQPASGAIPLQPQTLGLGATRGVHSTPGGPLGVGGGVSGRVTGCRPPPLGHHKTPPCPPSRCAPVGPPPPHRGGGGAPLAPPAAAQGVPLGRPNRPHVGARQPPPRARTACRTSEAATADGGGPPAESWVRNPRGTLPPAWPRGTNATERRRSSRVIGRERQPRDTTRRQPAWQLPWFGRPPPTRRLGGLAFLASAPGDPLCARCNLGPLPLAIPTAPRAVAVVHTRGSRSRPAPSGPRPLTVPSDEGAARGGGGRTAGGGDVTRGWLLICLFRPTPPSLRQPPTRRRLAHAWGGVGRGWWW